MAISWGLADRYRFTACGAITQWSPQSVPAVYSITFKQDPVQRPKAHTVLYFGETSDLSVEAHKMDEVIESCVDARIGLEELYIFMHPMPGSSKYERDQVQASLVRDYRPRGNGY